MGGAAVLLCLLAAPASAAAPQSPGPPVAAAPAPASDPLAQQLQNALAQQAQLDATKSALASEIGAAQDQQNLLATVVAANQKTIQATVAALADAEQRFHDASAREAAEQAAADLARKHEAEDRALLTLYIRARYMGQDDFFNYLLSSDTIPELMDRASSINRLIDGGDKLVQQVRRDIADATAAEQAAARDAAAAATAAAQLQAQQANLQDQTSRATALITQLNDQAKAAAAEIAAANTQTLALAQHIAQLRIQQLDATIAAADDAAWQAATYYVQNHLGDIPGWSTPVTPTNGSVRFVWPAPGSILTQGFGPSPYTFEPSFGPYPHFHTGLDLAKGLGAPVLAAADGVVVAADSSPVGYGNHIILAHGSATLTLYGHLQTMLVQPGAMVHQGQVIGLMGSTGNSTGPHLHFETRVNNQPVDPTPFLPPLAPGAQGPPP